MEALLISLGAALSLLLAVIGLEQRRIRLTEPPYPTKVKKKRQIGLVERTADALGGVFFNSLWQFYGSKRIAFLNSMLNRAGRPSGLTSQIFVRRHAGLIALGVAMAAVFSLAGQLVFGILMGLLFVVYYPIWLLGEARRRQAKISRELPDFLDVLSVTVSAGLSLKSALERVSAGDKRPLAGEIRRVLEDMSLGISRRQALSALRVRNNNPMISSWVTTMLQAEELGTPLSQALVEIADDIRREEAQLARRTASQASPKISMVITFIIMPGALLLIVGSMILSQWESLAPLLEGFG